MPQSIDDLFAMTAILCERCHERAAVWLAVPMTARLPSVPGSNRTGFRVEPETWWRLCHACADAAMETMEACALFDLATWRPPEPPPSQRAI
jgi:hypothetical protein